MEYLRELVDAFEINEGTLLGIYLRGVGTAACAIMAATRSSLRQSRALSLAKQMSMDELTAASDSCSSSRKL
jgi:hypothetical protein